MKIYTKTGDKGTTGLYSGERVPKFNARIALAGTLDELNSHLGVALSCPISSEVSEVLRKMQLDIFKLAADFATTENAGKPPARIAEADIESLESMIDEATAALDPLRNFIMPGGSPAASHIHLARTVCRRAERQAFAILESESVNPLACRFLNRLSDALFTLARRENQLAGVKETLWQPSRAGG